uniref:MADF domain-containing protein n=1 Tax=Ceratitis capitata TaxID=7213 RepID=W8CA19_CERCA
MLAPDKFISPMKQMTGAEENRHFLRAFIHTYRDLPVLWDTSLRDYTNRDKRAEAYEQLVPIYRYLKRDANVEDVKKKINTLRTNYRKELKVVESARRNGTIHHPRCWTYLELDFLRNTEKFLAVNPNTRGDSFSAFNENSQSQASFMDSSTTGYNFRTMMGVNTVQSPPSIAEMFHKSFGSTQKLEPEQTPPPTVPQVPVTSSTSTAQSGNSDYNHTGHQTESTTVRAKRLRFSPTNVTNSTGQTPEELLSIACDYLSGTFPEEESIARTWTHKLKRLQREQRLLAEKFINEILFEAESGTLHRGSVHINRFEPFVRFEEQSRNDNEQDKSQSPSVHTSTAALSYEGEIKSSSTSCTGTENANTANENGYDNFPN